MIAANVAQPAALSHATEHRHWGLQELRRIKSRRGAGGPIHQWWHWAAHDSCRCPDPDAADSAHAGDVLTHARASKLCSTGPACIS